MKDRGTKKRQEKGGEMAKIRVETKKSIEMAAIKPGNSLVS